MEPSTSSPAPAPEPAARAMLRRQTLETLMEEIQRALNALRGADGGLLGVPPSDGEASEAPENEVNDGSVASWPTSDSEHDSDQLYDLLKSGFQSPEFLQKIDETQVSVNQNDAAELDTSWDVIKAVDLWEDDDSDDAYVIIKQEDAAHSLAFFIATYILSLKKTKELSPDRIKKVLKKTLSAEKKKGKLGKACDRTKAVYNVASWGATAIRLLENHFKLWKYLILEASSGNILALEISYIGGKLWKYPEDKLTFRCIYHNQAILRVAATAFRTSCGVISKFL